MKQQYQSDAGKWLEILYGDEKAPLDYQVSGIESYRTYLFRQAKKYSGDGLADGGQGRPVRPVRDRR